MNHINNTSYFLIIIIGALYYGATHIPIADSTVLVFSTPIWTPFVAKIVTKEPFRLINFVAIGIGFVGVIFIAQPSVIFPHSDNSSNENTAAPGSLLYLIAAAFCVFGAILNSICFVLIRKSRGKVHFQVFVFYYGIIGSNILYFFIISSYSNLVHSIHRIYIIINCTRITSKSRFNNNMDLSYSN